MFETAELGSTLDKKEYDARVPGLRVSLVNAQYDLRDAGFSVVILIAGNDRLAANEVVDLINEWMDARFIDTRVFLRPTDEERERPRFWRYWRSTPPHGRTGLYFGAWAMNTIAERVRGNIKKSKFEDRIVHDRGFEEALANNGTMILKFWLHLPKKAMKDRLERARNKSGKAWRLRDVDWDIYKKFDKFMPLAGQYIRETDSAHARWHLVETTDARHRNLVIGSTIQEALQSRLDKPSQPNGTCVAPVSGSVGDVLGAVDLDATIPFDVYKNQQKQLQRRLGLLSIDAREAGISTVLVFEGWDAAGKGGVIRRITRAMAARDYRVIPIMAPTDEELAHNYLWRFWRHLPRAGRMLIFDRSWYGRVLVERVEGLAHSNDWLRAYNEINDFEEQLADHGMIVQKFWLHISPEEQLARFQAREQTPYKKYKITEEDYRNREKRNDYAVAINEMVARTSTEYAPWSLVAANDKRHARVQVLETVCKRLKHALG